jgi:hypothetical protein
MRVEATVLIAEQHCQIARIDLAGGGRQPPPPVGQGEGAQQPAVTVDDDRRTKSRRSEVERAEAFDIAVPRRRDAKAEDEDEDAECGEEAALASSRLALTPVLSRKRERGRNPSPACGRRACPRAKTRGWREAPDEGKQPTQANGDA